jgi:hypothetical protein
MVSFPLLKLPLELVTRILSFLYIPDLVSCQLTDRFLFNVIKDSVLLRYLIATEAACVEDNPHCNLSLSERLEQLKRREEAWSCCRIDFRREVPLQRKSTSIYDLTGGVYLLGDSRNGDLTSFRRPLTTGLSYLTLPSLSSHEPTWSRLDIKRNIIDIGLAIHEHDLIAIVTSFVTFFPTTVFALLSSNAFSQHETRNGSIVLQDRDSSHQILYRNCAPVRRVPFTIC